MIEHENKGNFAREKSLFEKSRGKQPAKFEFINGFSGGFSVLWMSKPGEIWWIAMNLRDEASKLKWEIYAR